MSEAFYRLHLKGELSRRSARNRRYSLRAFARALSLDPGLLSKVLAGQASLSLKAALKVVAALHLAPDEQRLFMESIADEHKQKELSSVSPEFAQYEPPEVDELDLETFRVIADVTHYALLELTFVEDFESSPAWIAGRLGISLDEAETAMRRLLQLGLLETDENGFLRKVNRSLTTKNKNVTTPAHKRHQLQVLDLSIAALENEPLETRSHTSMTMAIDPEKLPVAKKMIQDFMDGLCEFLESGKRKRVYQLGVGLFPMDELDT